jgi:hypothetical protein
MSENDSEPATVDAAPEPPKLAPDPQMVEQIFKGSQEDGETRVVGVETNGHAFGLETKEES